MPCFLSFSFVPLRQARLASNSQSSCLCLPRVGFAGLDSSESCSAHSPLLKPHGAMLTDKVTNDVAGNLKHARSDCLWRNMQKGAGGRGCKGAFFLSCQRVFIAHTNGFHLLGMLRTSTVVTSCSLVLFLLPLSLSLVLFLSLRVQFFFFGLRSCYKSKQQRPSQQMVLMTFKVHSKVALYCILSLVCNFFGEKLWL